MIAALWLAWFAAAGVYAWNEFYAHAWPTALAVLALLIVAASCFGLQTVVERKRTRIEAQARQLRDQERERAQLIQEVSEHWPARLLDMSVLYIQLQDQQRAFADMWRPDVPSRVIMHHVLHLRARCQAAATTCAHMRIYAGHVLEHPEQENLALSALLEDGFATLSMWSPGDDFSSVLPDMDQLASLTGKVAQA
jgi:hypothetical protein